MTFNPPARLDLARLPTPLEPLEAIGREIGVDLYVKRDDLTGIALSGNKVRKLEYLAAHAAEEGADVLVTCGAVNSNHARATAVVAARMGIASHLLLRGAPQDPPQGNLLLDRFLGATTTFITHAQWKDRDALMGEIAHRLAAEGRKAYGIPEGGSNGLGCLGYVRTVGELLAQERALGLRIRRVVHATGSGGTTAGLALGVAASRREDLEIVGVAVCDDRAYFDAKVGAVCDEAAAAGWVGREVRARARWRIVDGYKGEGYGKTTPEELAALSAIARRTGLFLDPVYTGKAFLALVAETRSGGLGRDGATVFLHTGGIFGLFDYGEAVAALGEGKA